MNCSKYSVLLYRTERSKKRAPPANGCYGGVVISAVLFSKLVYKRDVFQVIFLSKAGIYTVTRRPHFTKAVKAVVDIGAFTVKMLILKFQICVHF